MRLASPRNADPGRTEKAETDDAGDRLSLILKVPMAPTAEQSASRRRPPAMGPHTRIVATDRRSEVVQLAKALVGEMCGFRAEV
jgi:hypothetical protein